MKKQVAEDDTMRTQYTNPMIHKAFEVLETLSADELTRQRAEMREKAIKNEVPILEAVGEERLSDEIKHAQDITAITQILHLD